MISEDQASALGLNGLVDQLRHLTVRENLSDEAAASLLLVSAVDGVNEAICEKLDGLCEALYRIGDTLDRVTRVSVD